jgi:hypothetical protein
METLAEVSDAVQIATLFAGVLTTIFGGWMAYMMAKLKANSETAKENSAIAAGKVEQVRIATEGAAVKVEQVRKEAAVAAAAVEEVKTTLETTKRDTDVKLEGIARTGDITHTLVNSGLGVQLKLSAETSRFKANTTKNPVDIAAADLAEKTLADHQQKQRDADLLPNNKP